MSSSRIFSPCDVDIQSLPRNRFCIRSYMVRWGTFFSARFFRAFVRLCFLPINPCFLFSFPTLLISPHPRTLIKQFGRTALAVRLCFCLRIPSYRTGSYNDFRVTHGTAPNLNNAFSFEPDVRAVRLVLFAIPLVQKTHPAFFLLTLPAPLPLSLRLILAVGLRDKHSSYRIRFLLSLRRRNSHSQP